MANEDQARLWSADMGRNWVAREADLDALLQGALDLLIDRAGIRPGDRVLDIGCGTGAASLRAAGIAGPRGRVLGADISPIMTARAAERARAAGAATAAFLTCDAATHDFGAGSFDRVISRMGVMFFDDPEAAFRNIALAMRPGATLAFVAWGGLAGNPWFTLPESVAAARFGEVPVPGDPLAPGPMAFADTVRVAAILAAAGFAGIAAGTRATVLSPPGGPDEAARLATGIGPAARYLRERGASDTDRAAIERDLSRALERFVAGGTLRVPALLTLVAATRG